MLNSPTWSISVSHDRSYRTDRTDCGPKTEKTRQRLSLVSLQLALAPMMSLAVGIKDPFDVTVKSPHDADPGQHRGAAGLRNEDQRLHGRLPFGRGCSAFGSLHDAAGLILQGEEQAAIRKRYWILKRGRPGQ